MHVFIFLLPSFQVTKSVDVVESDLKSNKTEQSIKNANKSEADISKDKKKAEVSQSHYFLSPVLNQLM